MEITAPSLQVHQLSYQRAQRRLFHNLNFQLVAGELLLVTGPNGSGKTSLLRLLAGLSLPTAGAIYWGGQSIHAHTRYYADMAYLGHKTGLKRWLTVEENLTLAATLSGANLSVLQQPDIWHQFGLIAYRHCFSDQLSAGLKQRAALARLVIVPAKLWLIDEPFTAIDQAGMALFQTCLIAHCQRGGLVVMTSHQPITLDNITIKQFTLSS